MTQMSLFTKHKQIHIENKFMITKGEGGWNDKLRVLD